MQYNFQFLMEQADKAINYITEGSRIATELFEKYQDGKAVLSETEQSQLDAKLAELRSKSADTHAAIQAQD